MGKYSVFSIQYSRGPVQLQLRLPVPRPPLTKRRPRPERARTLFRYMHEVVERPALPADLRVVENWGNG